MSPTCPLSTRRQRGQWEKTVEGVSRGRVPEQRLKEKLNRGVSCWVITRASLPTHTADQLSCLLVLIRSAHNEQDPEVFGVNVLYCTSCLQTCFSCGALLPPGGPQQHRHPVVYFSFLSKMLKALDVSITVNIRAVTWRSTFVCTVHKMSHKWLNTF